MIHSSDRILHSYEKEQTVISICSNVDEFYTHNGGPIKSDTKTTDYRVPYTVKLRTGKANLW